MADQFQKLAPYVIEPTNVHTTSRKWIEHGIKRCDECGALNALETTFCCECEAFIVMFVDQ